MIPLRSADEIELIAESCKLVVLALVELRRVAKAGVTTKMLDKVAEEVIRDAGGEPAFKGYRGYPASLCASVNQEIVHGIPDDRTLVEGDIVGLDVGAKCNGYFGDAALTVAIEPVSEEASRLMAVTLDALHRGIDSARAGSRIGDIAHSIQSTVEAEGFSVVKSLAGHGIGREIHEEPEVPNFGTAGSGVKLESGMVLAIEPMVNAGSDGMSTLDDGWTVVTADGKLSAHFEHTIAITDNSARVLTQGWES
jgi:methionyl aminopeptidase